MGRVKIGIQETIYRPALNDVFSNINDRSFDDFMMVEIAGEKMRYMKNVYKCFATYKPFISDYPALKKAGIVKKLDDDHFSWTNSKTSLAEYFKWLQDTYNIMKVKGGFWSPVETTFLINGEIIQRGSLSHLANDNGRGKKDSKDFEKIKPLIEQYRELMKKQTANAVVFGEIKSIVETCANDDPDEIEAVLKRIIKLQRILFKKIAIKYYSVAS